MLVGLFWRGGGVEEEVMGLGVDGTLEGEEAATSGAEVGYVAAGFAGTFEEESVLILDDLALAAGATVPGLEHGETAVPVHIQAQNVASVITALASGRGCGCSRGVMSDCFGSHIPARVPVAAGPRNPSWHLTAAPLGSRAAEVSCQRLLQPTGRFRRRSLSLGR